LAENRIRLPLLESLSPGIFKFGTIVLVEFEAQSLWYETAYTLAAQALKEGIKTDFHIFQHPAEDVRQALAKLEVCIDEFQRKGRFRIIDSYTVQAGLGDPKEVEPYDFASKSLKISDWKSQMFNVLDSPQESNLIHIDENDSILVNYNTEAELLGFFRRTYTAARGRGFLFVYSLLSNVHSPSFYAQFESLADVVIDISSREHQGIVNHVARVRIARGSAKYDSKWRSIKILDTGEVKVSQMEKEEDEQKESAQSGRKLAAIMFTDIVGFTAQSQSNEFQALEVLENHNKLLRPFFRRYNGREIKTIGDSFLIEFESALDAVNCAIEIQKFLHDYNISSQEDWKIKLRIGIHLGDVVLKGGDIFGDAVNIASRIGPLAEPEGICLTQQVFDQVQNKVNDLMEQLEGPELKNVKFATPVYSVLLPWVAKRARTLHIASAARRELDPKRLAVLPFSSMSPDPNDEYLADGMTEELISTVSRIADLQVIARTSVLPYKGGRKRIDEIGKELKVGTILEGSVRRAGDRLRITAQLINSQDNRHLWSETYDRELHDIFAIQIDISQTVADALKIQLLQSERERIRKEPTSNIEAYGLYLKGREAWYQGGELSYRRALKYFEQAVSIDPAFALAYSGIADCYSYLGDAGYLDQREAISLAESAAKKAVELDEKLGEAHASLAPPRYHRYDLRGARAELLRAIELKPSYPQAHAWLGVLDRIKGNFDEALLEFSRARDLDPLAPQWLIYIARCLYCARSYDESMEQMRKVFQMDPSRRPSVTLAYLYVQKSMFKDAIKEIQALATITEAKDPGVLSEVGVILALSGMKEEAEKILHELESLATKRFVATDQIAVVYLMLGKTEKAFEFFSKAIDELCSGVIYDLKENPIFDPFKQDPRFVALLQRIGLRD
jgi:adenylate cyclase